MSRERHPRVLPVHAVTVGWTLMAAVAMLAPIVEIVDRLPRAPWMRLALIFAGGGLDKVVHALIFAVLAWLVGRSTSLLDWRRPVVLALGIGVGYGLILETAQRWIPGRNADPLDLAANVVGALIGAWIFQRGHVHG